MQIDQGQYKHLPVQGLPRSLIQTEGGTVAVIALMQRQAGLSRERRRQFQSGTKSKWGVGQVIAASISKMDRGVLTYYLSADDRWGSFWNVVRTILRRKVAAGTRAYAIAVDFQLLSAYDPKWQELIFKIEEISEICAEWPRIQESIERFWKPGKECVPLGVFMLWPRLLKDLLIWSALDVDQRIRVSHAIFSLSSISWTRWFIDEALTLCPEIEVELGELSGISKVRDAQMSSPENHQPALDDDSPLDSSSDGIALGSTSGWDAIGHELSRLIVDWAPSPSRALLLRIAEIGHIAGLLLAALPDDQIPPRTMLEDKLNLLRTHLLELAKIEDLNWLGSDDLESIMARWRLAVAGVQDDEYILELADDVAIAEDRLGIAINEMRSVQAHVEQSKIAAAALDEEVSRQGSAVRRIELSNRQMQAKEELLVAERKQTAAMLFVLASASPKGETFDPTVDYAAEFAARSSEHDMQFHPASNDDEDVCRYVLPPEEVIEAIADCRNESVDCVGNELAVQNHLTEMAESPDVAPVSSANITGVQAEQIHSVKPISSEAVAVEVLAISGAEISNAYVDQNDFTDIAGDQCRPIWALLEREKPTLAYQFANALHTTSTHLRVPPPALLRSVALAPGLIASDGPLAMSIGEAFAEIDRAWFELGDTPSNWHTALNLLLIAATLRPMVLAPAMGAAAIASYRHLSGRYSSLLELVRLVGEVSEPLTGFAIGPAVLSSAADEASQKAQLIKLQKDADDWLVERAPNKKIRYAPASKVWLHWLKPGEPIHKLISPVTRGAIDERNSIRSSVEGLSDYNAFLGLVRDTDRRQLDRRGQDIEAGALEHLWIATCEAVAVAKDWLGAESILSDSGGRLRSLVRQLQLAFDNHAKNACVELNESWSDDQWGQVKAASHVLRTEIQAIADMFKQDNAMPSVEIHAKELLMRDMLLVPSVSVAQDWRIESGEQDLLIALAAWAKKPIDVVDALDARVRTGDIAGALLLLQDMPLEGDDSGRKQLIEKTRDSWVKDIQRNVEEARRSSEVGLAYGYLSDEERASCESELSAVELSYRETNRFDQAFRRIKAISKKIEVEKERRIQEARIEFEREKQTLSLEFAKQVEVPLARSDIHTFNELMQRVRQGMEPWPDRDIRRDAFQEFFPELQTDLLGQLAKVDPADVDKRIRLGDSVGLLSFELEGDTQARWEAEEVYRAWASSVGRKGMSREGVRKILDALGMPVRMLEQDKVASAWSLQTSPILDREICPVPHFGSRAQGRYRVIVLAERLSAEDLLQRIGETSQQIATIVFVLSRGPARFWPDLARQAKVRQRSFLVLDESILLLLLSQRGSRLATWFNVALPFTYSEPYDASAGFVPPEMFYGRAAELEAVKAQGGCYFIYGGRQLGKTALLRRAEKAFLDPATNRYAVWIDLLAQGIGERRPAADVWLSVSDKLRELRIPGLSLPSVNPAKPTSIDAFLASIKVFLDTPGRRILLLLDEADHFFEQDARHGAYAETRRLKQLMDETDRRFKVVFAGLHNVLRTASTSNQPLGHLNEAVRIGPLMDEREIRAAEELITRPIEAAGFSFEDRSLVMRVLAQTNYYPSLIQLYCTQLLRHLRETKFKRRDLEGPRYKIYESDIESVFAGKPLRDAIRSKFRLTLQLDDRYEVIAYAIGLEALSPGYDHSQGIDWRTIRQDCATSWWPKGFVSTSERDFLALLEEMVELGVLSQAKVPERFSLRNPNVLLLLGSKQEIESTLQAEREPRIEFESTIFRPTLGGRVENPARNPLTYRQLDEVVQMRSAVSLVAASSASGIDNLLVGLRDQPGMADSRLFIQLDRANDKKGFVQELDKEIKKRVTDGITVMLVPPTVSWDLGWVVAAQAKVKALTSLTSFVSVVFVADPHRLWDLTLSNAEQGYWADPWLSVLPWVRGFVRKWLEELQLPTDAVDRLDVLTGFWGGLLESVARVKGGALDFANNLERMTTLSTTPEWRRENLRRLTGGIEEGEAVLCTLSNLGDGVSVSDLVEFGEVSEEGVRRALRWAEPLGLVVPQSGGAWALEPFTRRMFGDAD